MYITYLVVQYLACACVVVLLSFVVDELMMNHNLLTEVTELLINQAYTKSSL